MTFLELARSHPVMLGIVILIGVSVLARALHRTSRLTPRNLISMITPLAFKSRAEYLQAALEMDLELFLERAKVTPESIRRPLKKELGQAAPQPTSPLDGGSGASGAGASGLSGASGTSGFSGISGVSGVSGFSGASGLSGFSGISGRWYRVRQSGMLVRLNRMDSDHVGLFDKASGITDRYTLGQVEPAVPRQGEWWQKNKCSGTHGWIPGESDLCPRIFDNTNSGTNQEAAALCGCLSPVNWGLGNWGPSIPSADPATNQKARFKIGQWVRLIKEAGGEGHVGTLVKLTRKAEDLQPSWWGDCSKQAGLFLNEEWMEPALPKQGEWWVKKPCADVHQHPGTWDTFTHFEFVDLYNLEDPTCPAAKAALCGCLIPYEWGKVNIQT